MRVCVGGLMREPGMGRTWAKGTEAQAADHLAGLPYGSPSLRPTWDVAVSSVILGHGKEEQEGCWGTRGWPPSAFLPRRSRFLFRSGCMSALRPVWESAELALWPSCPRCGQRCPRGC